ncbi:MAG: VOC family protein [Nitrososphaera sp.]
MKVYRVSAVTLKVKDMEKSCTFYSKLPGFQVAYGGRATDSFTTFEVGEGSKMYINLELTRRVDSSSDAVDGTTKWKVGPMDFGRIIFHCEDVDSLYFYMKNDNAISEAVTIENEPSDAPWGERFFHVREPDGYQLSFAQPLPSRGKQKT